MNNITLRLNMTPDRRLAANRRGFENRWSRAPMIAAEREKALYLARDDSRWDFMEYESFPITDPVHVTVTIYWGKLLGTDGKMRQARRLDWDSATGLVKAMLDGALMDTGILADDRQIVAGTVLQAVAPDGDGFTTIEIERVGE